MLMYHLLMLAVVAGAYGLLARRRSGWMAGGLLVAVGLVSLTAVVFAGGTGFRIVALLCWALFAHVPLYLLGAAWLLRGRARGAAVACGVLAGLLLLTAADAFLIEPHWLDVSHVTIRSAKLTRPVRVAFITDIQTDRPGPYEERVLRRVAAERPDLILFGGDYVQNDTGEPLDDAADALRAILRRVNLRAPLGIYAVEGNVDSWETWRRIFAGQPVTQLKWTTTRDLGPLVLTGLSMTDSCDTGLAVPGQSKFHLVLGHVPDYSLGRVDADVLLAGHTHGGQVQLPVIGPLVTLTRVPRRQASGVSEIAPGKTLIVSRGIGMERYAPPLRFCCRPELVILELLPER